MADEHSLAVGKTFPWHEVYAPDKQAAIDFYREALDFGVDEMPMGEGFTYTMLSKNGTAIAGVMSTNDLEQPGVPPHWAVYLSVDDVDQRIEKVKSLGGSVVVPPMDIPTVGRMALIADPQGAHLWLYKSAEGG
jgi:uncharacterized protein